LLDQKGLKNSRQNDASTHRPLRWPAVLPGRGFLLLAFCHPDLDEELLAASTGSA
jgi:hypothetical protein